MSFLLRNRGSGGSGRVVPGGQTQNVNGTGRPRSTSSRGGDFSHGSSTPGIPSGNQMQLQRSAHPSQKQKGLQQNQGQKVDGQEQESQGMISMSEVLADLRILEQQQRDAQRKLTSTRATKVQRLEQHTALESKLENLKYSNGEFRAQLRQSRDILSTSTRALGSRRLVTDRAGGDIRDFEKKLSRGLQSVRVNAACRRKIDSLFILVENKLEILARVKTEAKTKLANLEIALQSERQKEESIRTAIQKEVSRAQQSASEIATARTQHSEAEKELLIAQNMEESTRTRVKGLACQIASESKQIEEQIADLSNQVDIEAKKSINCEEQIDDMKKCLTEKLQELNDAKRSQNSNTEYVTEHGEFDSVKVESAIESSNTMARDLQISNDALEEEIERMQEVLASNLGATESNRRACEELTNAAQEILTSETRRSEELTLFQVELDHERQTVQKLDESCQELKDARSLMSAKHNESMKECDETLESARQAIDVARDNIESDNAACKHDKLEWEIAKVDILADLEKAKIKSKVAEDELTELELVSKNLEDDFEVNLQNELRKIEEDQTKKSEEIKRKVEAIIKKRPMLQSVVSDFAYVGTISKRDHMIEALGPIKSALESRIRAAKEVTNRRKQMKMESRRRAEAVALAVKRNDEARRKRREQMISEHQRQDAEDSLDISSDGAGDDDVETTWPPRKVPNLQSKAAHRGASTRTSHGAEFFFPQSHDSVSEEETPAQPKYLLTSFSNSRKAPRLTPTDLPLSMDKRVHWLDDNNKEETQRTILQVTNDVKSQSESNQVGTFKRPPFVVFNDDIRGEIGEVPAVDTSAIKKSEPNSHVLGKSDQIAMKSRNDPIVPDKTGDAIITNSDVVKAARKTKQYGTSKRGLEAILRPKKSDTKPPKVVVKKKPIHLFNRKDDSYLSAGTTGKLSSKPPQEVEKKGSLEVQGSATKRKIEEQKSRDRKAVVSNRPQIEVTTPGARASAETNKQRACGGPSLSTPKSMGHKRSSTDNRASKTGVLSGTTNSKNEHDRSKKSKDKSESAKLADKKESRSAEKRQVCSAGHHIERGNVELHNSPKEGYETTHTKTSARLALVEVSRVASRSNSLGGTRSESSGKLVSKSVTSDPSRKPTSSAKSGSVPSNKRKLQEGSVSQISGFSSGEGAIKSRRRKKNGPSRRSTISMADDAYSFAF